MSDAVYAVLAYIARYWFALLLAVILWRAVVWMRKDAEHVAKTSRNLPDAGFIGEWAVVASDAPAMPAGHVMRAPRDGWIGSARACDIRLKDAGVPARAARFFLRPDGVHVLPEKSGMMLVDGMVVQREAVLRHGATLTVGGVTLQLRLFAGVVLTPERPARWRRRAPVLAVVNEYEEIEATGDMESVRQEWEQLPLALPRPTIRVKNCCVRRRKHAPQER